MTEPTPAAALVDPARLDYYRKREAELLAEIEAAGQLPPWAVERMHTTLAELRALPDGVAYAASHYLARVAKIGVRAFRQEQASLTAPATDRLHCACGRSVPVKSEETPPGGRRARYGECPACGHDVVAFG